MQPGVLQGAAPAIQPLQGARVQLGSRKGDALIDAKTRKAAMLATITETEEFKALAYELKQAEAAESAADAMVREAAVSALTRRSKPSIAMIFSTFLIPIKVPSTLI